MTDTLNQDGACPLDQRCAASTASIFSAAVKRTLSNSCCSSAASMCFDGLRHPVLTDDDDGLHVMRLGPEAAQACRKFAHGGGCNPIRQCGWRSVQNPASAADWWCDVMTTPQHHTAQAQVAKLLPSGWDLERDILLIVGENAGQIARPFVAHGLKRVWVMLPAPLRPSRFPTALLLRSRGSSTGQSRCCRVKRPERCLLRTPRCSLDPSVTQSIRALAMSLLKRKPANEHIHMDLAPRWALNGFKNLVRVGERPLVSDLKDDFTDVPMIIVGAGPSLAKNIEHLRSAQEKAIIVCVARALNSLQSAGIVPDFAISGRHRCSFALSGHSNL